MNKKLRKNIFWGIIYTPFIILYCVGAYISYISMFVTKQMPMKDPENSLMAFFWAVTIYLVIVIVVLKLIRLSEKIDYWYDKYIECKTDEEINKK